MTITSFCADLGYEMVTAVLPGFLNVIGVAALALGWIEGAADAISSFVKLGAGWYSDRIGHRKGIVAFGYFLSGTALSVFAFAWSWPLILLGRMVAWFGKGIRGPLRDALLSESVEPEVRGKVFGLHRAGDTLGAVLGPLAGVWLLGVLPRPTPDAPFRSLFLLSLVPGLAAVASMLLLVREKRRGPNREHLWTSLRGLPRPYLRFLRGVGLFGMGDFSHTLLVLAAAQLLEPAYGPLAAAQIAALLYVLRNAVYAAVSFPVGALADRVDKEKLLAAGYVAGAVTGAGLAVLFASGASALPYLVPIFAGAGIYIGMEDALEGAIPADLVNSPSARGTAYGVMGTVNGVGDLAASALVGSLWTAVSPVAGFAAAAVLMLAGAGLTFWNATRRA